jgi:hypothetical protein
MNHWIVFAMHVAALTLFIWNRIPAVMVSIRVPLALFFTCTLPINHAWGGFGDLTVIFISRLFVVAARREASGITIWSGQIANRKGRSKANSPAGIFMLSGALFCATTSVGGTVVVLLASLVVGRFKGTL